jgi:hypothetical protein
MTLIFNGINYKGTKEATLSSEKAEENRLANEVLKKSDK